MKLKHSLFITLITLIISNQSFAGGYSTGIYSTSGLANAYAGSVTGVHDISDVFFNPSVTSGIKNNQAIASATYLRLNIHANDVSGNFSGGNAVNGTEGNANTNNFVPAFYLATPINDKTTFNLAVTSPFGLSTKYNSDWAGRYRAIESSIATANVNPSLSYQISDKLSVGAGVMAQYYQATLTKAVNIGSGVDAIGKMDGSDWGYGYNLGASYKFNDKLKFGIGYRSKIDYNLSGTTKIDNTSYFSHFNAKTVTPESLTAGTAYQLTPKIDLAYDVTWTRWSRLKSFSVNAYQNSQLSETTNFNWHDSFMHSLGANFKVNSNSLIRVGLAYEKDAVTDANREPRIPTSDKFWTAIGFNQKIKNGWSFDGTYCHQFYTNAKMNIPDSSTTVNSLQANYRNSVDVVSIALRKDF